MTATPIHDELILEQLDDFAPPPCEIVMVCEKCCCREACEEAATWVMRAKGHVFLVCTPHKEALQAMHDRTASWSRL